MKKISSVLVLALIIGLLSVGCNSLTPTVEENESGTSLSKASGDLGEIWNDTQNIKYDTIQMAIDNAAAGDTITIGPGTYTENIVIDKRLTLQGAGSGADDSSNTIITSSTSGTPVITITASGSSEIERLVISNLRVDGSGTDSDGIDGIRISSIGSHITLDGVASVNNSRNGVEARWDGTAVDIEFLNCTFSDNTLSGFKQCDWNDYDGGSDVAIISGLTITDTKMDGNGNGMYLSAPITGLQISGGSFDDNRGDESNGVGIWAQELDRFDDADKLPNKFSGFTANRNNRGIILHTYGPFSITGVTASNNLEGITFATNGEDPEATGGSITDGILISNVTASGNTNSNLWAISYLGWTLSNLTIEDCQLNGSNGYGLYLYVKSSSTLSGVTVTGCEMTENNTGVYLRALDSTATLTGVSITENEILNNKQYGILVTADAASGNEAHLNNIVDNDWGIKNNDNTVEFNATCNWYGDICGPSGEGPGDGDAVSTQVDFNPWLIDKAPEGPCGVGLPICYDETAWAYGEGIATPNNTITGNNSNNWGWTNHFTTGFPVTLELWAAAGQNDTANGFKVGTVTVEVEENDVTVTYKIDETLDTEYQITEAHLWVGCTALPEVKQGKKKIPTAAPGQFPYRPVIASDGKSATIEIPNISCKNGNGNGFWVAAHAVVEWCEEWSCP